MLQTADIQELIKSQPKEVIRLLLEVIYIKDDGLDEMKRRLESLGVGVDGLLDRSKGCGKNTTGSMFQKWNKVGDDAE